MTRKVCIECKTNLAEKRGKKYFYKKCTTCRKRGKSYAKRQYGSYIKKPVCDCCGFVAVNRCQMDVDHIDGNRNNDHSDNLQTLCSNCHRLKTALNGENMSRYDGDKKMPEEVPDNVYNLTLF